MKGFPAAARESLQDTQLRRNLGKATQTIRAKRLRTIAELARLGGAARGGRRDQGARDGDAARAARAPRGSGHRAPAARSTGRATARRRPRSSPGIAEGKGAREVIKVKSLATDEIGLNEAPGTRAGSTAIETDLAELIIQLAGDKQSHILVPGDPQEPRRDPGAVRAHDREGRGPRLGGDRDRRGRPPAPAREVPHRAGRRQRRELRDRRDRHGLRRRVRGQRAHVHDAARGAHHGDGDREGAARVAGPRGLPAAAAALLDGRADEPVHVAVDRRARRATGRRSSTSSCSTTGARDVLADEVGRQALHCIRCSACLNVCPVYERAGGQAYESVYPGPDRRDPHAAAARARPGADAAVGLVAVRRVLRGVPGQDRHPVGARPPARARRARRSSRATRRSALAMDAVAQPSARAALRARAAALEARPRPAGQAARCRAGARCASCPRCPPQTFREWWRERRAG